MAIIVYFLELLTVMVLVLVFSIGIIYSSLDATFIILVVSTLSAIELYIVVLALSVLA